MIIGYEYQKGPRFESVFCHRCLEPRLAHFDHKWLFPIDSDDETVYCDICGRKLGEKGNNKSILGGK